ncbi:hypothetical protein EXS65_03165 [Candidatus Peribacteria bacterium]|nr:hypothetical protein [Candidatus Peribacteria bacterium]
MSPKVTPPPQTLEQKLDRIVLHLERLDKRDKMRTIGGGIRFFVNLIPLALFLGGGWYFINHTEEFMKMIADQAASSAAEYTKNQTKGGIFDQLMKQVTVPKK